MPNPLNDPIRNSFWFVAYADYGYGPGGHSLNPPFHYRNIVLAGIHPVEWVSQMWVNDTRRTDVLFRFTPVIIGCYEIDYLRFMAAKESDLVLVEDHRVTITKERT